MKKQFLLVLSILLATASVRAQKDYGDEWDDYFMPGIGYKIYVPKAIDSIGLYQGVITEFVIFSRAKGKDSYRLGPSRVKTYGNLSIMNSNIESASKIFSASLGLNLSFEAKALRKSFIPYFGLEVGGLYKRNFSTFTFNPLAGIQLVSTRKIIWSVQGGYQYTTHRFENYSGYIAATTINLLLWH